MIPDNVTLIVKAPNQQIEDQNIECLSSWTVRQLKGHLSEVYPSKPKTDEQKIIYSGQLLDDNTILKDVLRTYDTEITHTMHLVCKPSRTMPTKEEKTPTETATSGLRQRNVTQTDPQRPVETARPETRQNDQNHTVEMQNYMNSFVNNYGRVPPYPNYNFGEGYLQAPNDPAMYANHMMMIQQAYLQYMQQYANMRRAAPEQTTETEQREAQAPPQQPAEARPPPVEEPAPRDWLDQVYAASRLAILLSLVCLYGSPARLLLVVLLAAAAYLHQIGFFRVLNVPQNNAPPQTQASAQENEPTRQQSLLASTWIIVTSFFASLIPDTN
ncbi:homocysteine-responsive endoplasmic reticulum-resident ubiquitin-like domain member 2 protein [Battus philenor]|uniref:homocysteine-responsive endoplasmic reticulum-resident ubiquitin-like domain member 2 protein n=1 Tax=Battus philenor TaxID=42288 RepID=UPI0035CEA886